MGVSVCGCCRAVSRALIMRASVAHRLGPFGAGATALEASFLRSLSINDPNLQSNTCRLIVLYPLFALSQLHRVVLATRRHGEGARRRSAAVRGVQDGEVALLYRMRNASLLFLVGDVQRRGL